jgi:hypothetical protein
MAYEKLDLGHPIAFATPEEHQAAIAFFNAAFRAEESGLRQAHELADEVARHDPDLAECLRLYGDEEGWHRELLTEFLTWLGGTVRPMGRTTRTFYDLYARARRMESIVLVNLMFETIGSTTYRLALRRATHPAVRQMLTILTRDESFHVPLNVHFLRAALALAPDRSSHRLRAPRHVRRAARIDPSEPASRGALRSHSARGAVEGVRDRALSLVSGAGRPRTRALAALSASVRAGPERSSPARPFVGERRGCGALGGSRRRRRRRVLNGVLRSRVPP